MDDSASNHSFDHSTDQTNIKADAQRSALQLAERKSRTEKGRTAIMLPDKKKGQHRPKLPNEKSGAYHRPPPSTKSDHSHLSRKPCESNSGPGRAKGHSLSSNDSSKSSLKKRTSASSLANLDCQRQGTVFVKLSQANKQLGLENQCSNTSTAERSIDRSNGLIENGESNLTAERTAGSNHRSNSCQEFRKDLSILSIVDCSLPAAPICLPVWRGSFNIWNKKDYHTELVAHVCNMACEKVYNEACRFTPVLHLEIIHKSKIWPKSFGTSETSGENIALYFFPSDIRNERVFDQLVDEMQQNELALRAIVQNAELLVFTSTELQQPYWRFRQKYYLWGVFRTKQDGLPNNANLGKAAMPMKSFRGSSPSACSYGSTT